MKPVSAFNLIDRAYPYGIRGTQQQTDNGLLWKTPSFTGMGTGRLPGLSLGYFAMHNRAGASTYSLGIGVRIPNIYWKYLTWVDATTTATDVTSSAQGTTTAVDFNTLTTSDGHIIASVVPFNVVSYNISQSVTGSPVNALRYSNTAGTGWTALTNNYALPASAAATFPVTGEAAIGFAPPTDWGKHVSGLGTGSPVGSYLVNLRSTTAPTQKAQATGIELFRMYFITEAVADNGTLSQDWGAKDVVMAWDENEGLYGDALVAAFLDSTSGTNGVKADVGNRVAALVRAL